MQGQVQKDRVYRCHLHLATGNHPRCLLVWGLLCCWELLTLPQWCTVWVMSVPDQNTFC
jgi:hypothetical protein